MLMTLCRPFLSCPSWKFIAHISMFPREPVLTFYMCWLILRKFLLLPMQLYYYNIYYLIPWMFFCAMTVNPLGARAPHFVISCKLILTFFSEGLYSLISYYLPIFLLSLYTKSYFRLPILFLFIQHLQLVPMLDILPNLSSQNLESSHLKYLIAPF